MNKVVYNNQPWYGRNTTIILDDGNAYVMVSVLEGHDNVAIIHDLNVHKLKRGEGLGTKLLEEACTAAREMNVEIIRLSVKKDSWLQEWYGRHGFVENGEDDEFVGVEGYIVMEKEA